MDIKAFYILKYIYKNKIIARGRVIKTPFIGDANYLNGILVTNIKPIWDSLTKLMILNICY